MITLISFSSFAPGRRPILRGLQLVCLVALAFLLAGCGGHQRAKIQMPPVPTISTSPSVSIPIPPDAQPIYVETGMASWYGAPYHKRAAANGETYDMNQPTAAHRTLPLNSIVRVTNLATSHSVLVRITDRGPFVPDRIIDLSVAAAKAADVWRPGTARVRLDVLQAPAPLDEGGRWCVQIGGIRKEKDARKLQDKLTRRYHSAKVLAFLSPVGVWWVRVRVQDDDRRRAEELIRETEIPEGNIFLVRLD